MWFRCFNRKGKSESDYRKRAKDLYEFYHGKLACYIYGDMGESENLNCNLTFLIIDGMEEDMDGTISYVGRNLYFEVRDGKLAFYSNNGRCPIYLRSIVDGTAKEKKLIVMEDNHGVSDVIFNHIEYNFEGREIDVDREKLENTKKLGNIVHEITGMDEAYDKVINEYKQVGR